MFKLLETIVYYLSNGAVSLSSVFHAILGFTNPSQPGIALVEPRIALVGLKGAGKDYIATHHFPAHQKISFAGKLKDVVAVLFDLPREMLEGDTTKSRIWREQEDERLTSLFDRTITPRWLLQVVRTEVFRESFPGIWYKLLRIPEGNVIVTDCRFPDEMRFLKSKGFKIYHVYDGREPSFDDHPSEWSFTLEPVDGVINNFRD